MPGIPLREYRQLRGWGVRIICDGCQHTEDVDLEKVIDGLKARGLGDEATGIRAVARTLKRRCKHCGALKWETRPAPPPGPEPGGVRTTGQPKGYLS